MSNTETLIKALGENRTKRNEPLSLHTTLGIGGPADVYYEAYDSTELVGAVRLARNLGLSVTVIGAGSNILVGDGGIRGLTVKNAGGRIAVGDRKKKTEGYPEEAIESRWQSDRTRGTFKYEFTDINYEEWDEPRVEVTLDSGVNLQGALWKLLDQGITGLQWYARIPGTLGGAAFNNIHGGTHTIDEILERVTVLDEQGDIKTLHGNELSMGYDESRFHRSGEIILEVVLDLFLGNSRRAKETAREWARRKAIQPARSAGCVFKNIADEDRERLGLPTSSAGYIVEHVLKMGDFRAGNCVVSTAHHNFIVNTGGASAKDFMTVRDEMIRRAKESGITLEPEILMKGEF